MQLVPLLMNSVALVTVQKFEPASDKTHGVDRREVEAGNVDMILDLDHVRKLIVPVIVRERFKLVNSRKSFDTLLAFEDLAGDEIKVAHMAPATTAELFMVDVASNPQESNRSQMRLLKDRKQSLNDCKSGVSSHADSYRYTKGIEQYPRSRRYNPQRPMSPWRVLCHCYHQYRERRHRCLHSL